MSVGAKSLEGAHRPPVPVLDLIEILQEAIGETRAACDGLRLATIGLAEEDGADVSGLTALAEIVLEKMDDLAAKAKEVAEACQGGAPLTAGVETA